MIVKKLNAVESLGSCTIIASDKTGTLTVNQQTAKSILFPSGENLEITGTGYNDQGEVVGATDTLLGQAKQIGFLGMLNNEATLEKNGKQWKYYGDSIDIAFLSLGRKLECTTEQVIILDRIPYESENQFSAVFYQEKEEVFCTVKGSVEQVLAFSKTMGSEQSLLDEERIKKQNESLAAAGYRVLGIAKGKVNRASSYDRSMIQNWNFEGLVGFIDPIRKEAKQSIEETMVSGIQVVMITGDHPLTAYTIASELGLVTKQSEVASGDEIEQELAKGQTSFDHFIKGKKVFSRVTPLEKLEIVNSYKRQGEFIAVTGDGVNDAPALKSANIGIAMGSGTDVAKETASMIILDDNFQSIVAGIKEGRNAYSNIRKVSYMLLSCGFAEVLFFLLSILFDLPMPLVAVQLLWLNVVTDGLQDLALSFEKAETGIMKEKPRSTKESLFNRELIWEVGIAGLVIGLLVFGVWTYLIKVLQFDVAIARGYIMALMVFIQNIHVLNCRSEKDSIVHISFRSNPFILISIASAIVLQVIVMEVPVLSQLLQTSSIPFVSLLYLFLLSFAILLVMEIYKYFKRKNS